MSLSDETATWPATRQAAAIRNGEYKSRDLLELMLDRIGRFDPPLNAVATLDTDRARAAADAADRAAADGEWRGPLHGLPITVKDAIEVAGLRSTGGAVELAAHVPATDAPAVASLRDAGAVVFGKTNVPRWSGDIQTYNEMFGTTNNPWATERSPGGSSGGPAVAVSCGFTSFELGTDIGGSVRIPSHCTGIFGHKPSFGVIPQRGYLDHVGGGTTDADINVFGPLARSAEDLEMLLSVLAAPAPEMRSAWRLELPAARHPGPKGYRVGLWLDDSACPVDAEMLSILRGAADALADAGASVSEAHPPVPFEAQRDLFFAMIGPAVSVSAPEEHAEAVAGNHRVWLANREARAEMQRTWATWFEDYDAVLCPVMATPAIAHDQDGTVFERTVVINGMDRSYADLLAWTGLIGIVGLPACVPPLPPTKAGLPVGVQVVTPYLRDLDAIRLGGILAEVSGGGYRTPPLAQH